MYKRVAFKILVVMTLMVSLFSFPVAAQPVAPQAKSAPTAPIDPARTESATTAVAAVIDSVAGSDITTTDLYSAGGTFNMCFTALNGSSDAEWLTEVTLTFPAGWTAACESQDPTDSGGSTVDFACAATDNEVSYTDTNGGYGEIYGGNTWGFCIDVTAPGAASGTQSADWYIAGDDWGSAPHELTGAVSFEELAPLMLTPGSLEVTGCNGVTQPHIFNLFNNTGITDTFALTYTILSGNATFTGPDSIYLAHGVGQDLLAELTPDLCVPGGLEIVAQIEASGAGETATSIITKTVVTGMIEEWQSATPTTEGVRYHAVAYHDGVIYQFGGETGWWISDTSVYGYDLAAGTWSAKASLPVGTYGMDAVTIGDLIYVVGGSDDADDTGDGGTFLATLRIYDPATDSWDTGADMPVALAYASAVAYAGKLYVIGGENDAGAYVDTLYIYDPATDAWSTGASMSVARGYAAAAAIGDLIYVAGGFNGSAVVDDLEIYDPAGDAWAAGAAAPKAAGFYGDGVFMDKFVAFNGDAIAYDAGTTYSCSADAYIYDPATDTWEGLPALNRCLYGSQGVGADNRFYVVSGRTNEGSWHMATEVEYLETCPICDAIGWMDGYVYDYDGQATPCQNAEVMLEPGGQVIPVDVSGYYTAAVVPWDYMATASAQGYPMPDGPYAATVNQGQVTTQDFTLSRADISVTPTSFSEALVAPDSVTRQFTITNDGDADLHYEIFEVADTAAVLATPPFLTRQLTGDIDVDAQVLDALEAEGAADFFVQVRAQAELSPAYDIQDWSARGQYVYDSLVAASAALDPIIAYAEAAGLKYQTFLGNNSILLEGAALKDVEALADRADVYRIRANRINQLERNEITFADIQAYGWNLAGLDPNAGEFGMDAAGVWDEYGITGEGIVVANIDTGIYYEHEALIDSYRGNLGGSFDHEYSWYQPFNVAGTCGDGTYPCDWNGHGSGTAGIMAGETADLTEQVGIAPDAKWIGCMGCEEPPNGCSDAALMACGDWIAAPTMTDGTNPNPDMRPHVVNNSWGGDGCDNWYDGYVAAWRAGGIFPAFSAGNTVACGAVGAPGDSPDSFGTAAHNSSGDNQYAGGPSCYFPDPSCDPDAHEVDPHLNAPTFGRTSGNTQGSYYNLSGTSGASPHTAGCVALIWAANPGMIGDIDETFKVLEQTADRSWTDASAVGGCGQPTCAGADPYPNYEYGWGYLDCYSAVSEVYNPDVSWLSVDPISGTLPGQGADQIVDLTFTCTVTDAQQAQPLEATVTVFHDDPCEPPVEIDVELYCTAEVPFPTWDKEVWINGEMATVVGGPHTVRPMDTVTIVDYVGAAFSENITATLKEQWDDALELVGYDTGGIGAVVEDPYMLTWVLTDVAPNVMYPITKTFAVLHGDWMTSVVTETYTVENEGTHLNDVNVTFEQHQPAMALIETIAPQMAYSGDAVSVTFIISSSGGFRGTAHFTDTLPAGMAYVPGTIAADHGEAWEAGNVIYWHSYTATVKADIMVGVLSPDVDAMADFVAMIDGFDGITAERVTGDLATMTAGDLAGYDVIAASNNNQWAVAGGNPNVGNILADYVDAGGKLVMSQFAWDYEGWELEGRLMDQNYTPFQQSTAAGGAATLGAFDNTHPIMQGVTALAVSGTYGHMVQDTTAGATFVADWSTGQPLIYTQGNAVVGFNFLYEWTEPDWPWTGDGALILENSINWLASQMAPPMPAEVAITFDAVVTGNPGDIIENYGTLDWESDWTTAMDWVEILDASAVTVTAFGANSVMIIGVLAAGVVALGLTLVVRKRR